MPDWSQLIFVVGIGVVILTARIIAFQFHSFAHRGWAALGATLVGALAGGLIGAGTIVLSSVLGIAPVFQAFSIVICVFMGLVGVVSAGATFVKTRSSETKSLPEQTREKVRSFLALGSLPFRDAIVATIFGIIVTAVGSGMIVWSSRFMQGTLETEGIVIRLVEGGKKNFMAPVVRYRVNNRDFEFQSSVSSSVRMYSKGDKVTVLYHPETPGDGRIKSTLEQWILPVALIVSGLVVTVMGVRSLMRVKRKPAADLGASGKKDESHNDNAELPSPIAAE